mmetsp:Transcript_50755/g.94526  ORF Transcript_50755/g.94526 Transcript_50755/m.94526 type:complete len:354 (+) Transcript_50755:1213-2274(+)
MNLFFGPCQLSHGVGVLVARLGHVFPESLVFFGEVVAHHAQPVRHPHSSVPGLHAVLHEGVTLHRRAQSIRLRVFEFLARALELVLQQPDARGQLLDAALLQRAQALALLQLCAQPLHTLYGVVVGAALVGQHALHVLQLAHHAVVRVLEMSQRLPQLNQHVPSLPVLQRPRHHQRAHLVFAAEQGALLFLKLLLQLRLLPQRRLHPALGCVRAALVLLQLRLRGGVLGRHGHQLLLYLGDFVVDGGLVPRGVLQLEVPVQLLVPQLLQFTLQHVDFGGELRNLSVGSVPFFAYLLISRAEFCCIRLGFLSLHSRGGGVRHQAGPVVRHAHHVNIGLRQLIAHGLNLVLSLRV